MKTVCWINLDMSPLNIAELEASLKEEDAFIKQLIDTIPPKFYFGKDVQEKIAAQKHAHTDKTLKGLQGCKGISSKVKHKRAKLDPQCQKSVSQIQSEITEGANKKKKKKVTFKTASLTRAENIEELQKRLQEKVNELQVKRRGCSAQEFLERNLQKKEKKKLKKAKQKQKGNFSKEKPSMPKTENVKPQKQIDNNQVYNKDGNVIFSKFEFSEPGFEIKKKGAFSGKNYKKLLGIVEKEQEKINELREKDAKKADDLVQKKAWKRAIEKAEGVKVKDNPVLLKKSFMKQEKKKRKSVEVWKQREEHVENKKKRLQEKRQKNIQNKKKGKQQAKLKRAKKKGRIIPGFS